MQTQELSDIDAEIAVLIRKAIADDEKAEREQRKDEEAVAALMLLLNQVGV